MERARYVLTDSKEMQIIIDTNLVKWYDWRIIIMHPSFFADIHYKVLQFISRCMYSYVEAQIGWLMVTKLWRAR